MENKSLDYWQKRFIQWLEQHWIQEDKSHDIQHLHRVWRNAEKLWKEDGSDADLLVLLAAAYFHDLVTVPKSNPLRQKASWLSAEKTIGLLASEFAGFPVKNYLPSIMLFMPIAFLPIFPPPQLKQKYSRMPIEWKHWVRWVLRDYFIQAG